MALLTRPHTLPSNAQLSALLDTVAEPVLLFDPRQRLSFCNPAAQQVFGCEAGQMPADALARLPATIREPVLVALRTGSAASAPAGPWLVTPEGGTPWRLTLAATSGGALALRAAPALQPPRLAPGASGELVRLLWDTPLPLALHDRSGVLLAANRACVEAFGEPLEQLLGQDPIERVPDEDRPALRDARQRLLALLDTPDSGAPPAVQTACRYRDAQGAPHWYRQVARWVSADDGAPLLLVLLHPSDPPPGARPTREAEADQQGRELDQWFDLSPIGMLVYDASGLVVRSNAAFANLVGCAPVLLTDAPSDVCQLLAWEGDAPHPDLQSDGPGLEVRTTVTRPDGQRQRLSARLRSFPGPAQDAADARPALRVMAVVEDRSLEDEHDLAQLEIATLMDTAGMGVATFEASRGWLKSAGRPARGPGVVAGAVPGGAAPPPAPSGSPAAKPGLPAALQAIHREHIDPGSRDEFERLQRALRDAQRAQVRYAVNLPDIGRRWLLTRVEPGELTGGRAALSVVTLDVTEQEEAHRRNEQLLRELSTILDATTAGIGYLRGEQLVRCNRRFESMLGLPPGRGAGAMIADLLAGQPAAQALLRRALAEDGRHETELARPSSDSGSGAGAPQWLALSASRAPARAAASGETAGEPELVVVLTDVSRLKSQQSELETLARERELMFSLSDVGVSYLRRNRIERANAALAELTGYSVDELQQMHQAALFEDEAVYASLWTQQEQALQVSGHWTGERRLRRRDGTLRWVQVSKRRVDADDMGAGLICSYVDIDERRRAREAVQLQAERTRAILDSVLVGIVTVGDGGIEWMNRSARRMFGGELADFVGEPIAIVATAEPDHPLRATHYRAALADGQAETFECRLRARDGREFWVVGNAVVTGRGQGGYDPGGASQITFALLDIERRRQAEVSIAQAQASLQRIIETAPLAIALFDGGSGRVLRLNQMAASFFGRPVEAVLGQPPEAWFSPLEAAAMRADLHSALAQTEVLRREVRRPVSARVAAGATADGSDAPEPPKKRVWDMRVVSLANPGGAPGAELQLLLVASDVTEQRAAEQARFDAAIAQREMLVKEVHHRIKNNLQGVAGLLQQTAVRRPEVATLIGEAVGQVQAIAQVHGLQVGASGPLRIKPLVDAITASVQRTFGRAITVQVEGTPPHRFALPEAESIPIALTVNELLTNAVKHGAPGEIRCVLTCDEARLAISIYNPGQLKEGFTLAAVPPGVSGLGLVRALLPRRTATLTLTQAGVEVEAKVVLVPPGITLLEPL